MKDSEVRIGMLVGTPSGDARVQHDHRYFRSNHKQWWSLRIVESGLEAYYTADRMVELPLTHREHERLHSTSARRRMVDTNLVPSQVDFSEYVNSVTHREQMQRDQEAFEIVVREAADLRRRLEETSNACNDALNHVEELQGEAVSLRNRLAKMHDELRVALSHGQCLADWVMQYVEVQVSPLSRGNQQRAVLNVHLAEWGDRLTDAVLKLKTK